MGEALTLPRGRGHPGGFLHTDTNQLDRNRRNWRSVQLQSYTMTTTTEVWWDVCMAGVRRCTQVEL